MKHSRFSDKQIISILKQFEAGISAADLCREHGISSATFLIQFKMCSYSQHSGFGIIITSGLTWHWVGSRLCKNWLNLKPLLIDSIN